MRAMQIFIGSCIAHGIVRVWVCECVWYLETQIVRVAVDVKTSPPLLVRERGSGKLGITAGRKRRVAMESRCGASERRSLTKSLAKVARETRNL